MLSILLRVRNRHFFATDIICLPAAAYLSFVLRLETFNLGPFWGGYVVFAGLSLMITLALFRSIGVYTRYWRYASVEELMLLASCVLAAALIADGISLMGVSIAEHLIQFPRSVPVTFFLVALGVTAGPRLAVRWIRSAPRPTYTGRQQRVLVMGAGDAGAMIVRELRQNPHLGLEVVGFVDDDPDKREARIHGVPVLGNRAALPDLVQSYGIQQVVIAMPTAPGKVIREIVVMCERANVPAKTMPGMYELLGGKVRVSQLRDVQIEDLLRRDPIQTDIAAVGELIRGKRVLITGGGGSIGSELCRQVIRCEPAELIVVGHGENSVFAIEQELSAYFALQQTKSELVPCKLTTVIADIRFADRIRTVFETYQPEIVFHAAAHKHVPLMELNPAEAITNNVLGTRNLVDAALAVDVEQFVMISTDKAVNPTSIMGASKRAAELVVHRAAKTSGKPYLAVRFGNVLGSRGSVVLTFKQQIAVGGPVTVTHPEMCRYFMTIPEAVQLVLQAAVLGNGGEVFVLNMGEPVKIVDLARDMIELSGLEVGRDIDIAFTGLRPGEKLYEELFIPGEEYQRTHHEKIFIAANASSFVPTNLELSINELADAAEWNDRDAIVSGLKRLVPEFKRPVEVDVAQTEPVDFAAAPLQTPASISV